MSAYWQTKTHYTYIYVYIHRYIHTNIHIPVHIHTYLHTNQNLQTTYRDMYIHIYILYKGCWKKNVPFWNTHSNSVNFQPTDFVQISMELSWKYGFNDVNKLFLRWLVQKLLRDMLETLEVWKWQLLYRVFHLNFHFFNF